MICRSSSSPSSNLSGTLSRPHLLLWLLVLGVPVVSFDASFFQCREECLYFLRSSWSRPRMWHSGDWQHRPSCWVLRMLINFCISVIVDTILVKAWCMLSSAVDGLYAQKRTGVDCTWVDGVSLLIGLGVDMAGVSLMIEQASWSGDGDPSPSTVALGLPHWI